MKDEKNLIDRIIKSKFYIPSKDKYQIYSLQIKKSTIPNAGLGVFANEFIPKGSACQYKGERKSLEKGNPYYSWSIFEYNTIKGNPISGKELYLLDATNISKSNWTRYVNCGLKKNKNNLDSKQEFDQIYYYAIRDINPGEELFIDYGPGYRKVNLRLEGRY
jgi:SET domain-containing protein